MLSAMDNVYLNSKESLLGESERNQPSHIESAKSKETFTKFNAIIQGYLNGEELDQPEDSARSILSSYSLAAYLEHSFGVGRDVVITNLLSYCSSLLQTTLQ